MAWTQVGKDISICTRVETPKDAVLLSAVKAQEYISQPFLYKCVLLCPYPGYRIAEQLVGTWATIRIKYQDLWTGSAGGWSYLTRSGVIRSCKPLYSRGQSQPGQPAPVSNDTVHAYIAELVPWLSLLDLTTDFRIFQDMSVLDILHEVVNEEVYTYRKSWFAEDLYDFEKVFQNKEQYSKLEYCVQNRETTFNFLSRLMEEYGIFYYFDHGDEEQQNVEPTIKHSKLVLCDKNEHLPPLTQRIITPNPPTETEGGSVDSWNHKWEPRSHEWTLARANFAHPQEPIRAKDSSAFGATGYSRYNFPDRAVDTKDEERRVKRREELEITGREIVEGSSTDCKSFFGGGTFGFFANAEDSDGYPLLPEEYREHGPPDRNAPIQVQGRQYALLEVRWTAEEPYEGISWAGIAKIAEDDFSLGTATGSGFGQVTQQAGPPTIGTQYPPINFFSWFTAGILAKFVSDLFGYLFKDRKFSYSVTFTAVPLVSRYFRPDAAAGFPLPFRPARVTPKPQIFGPLLGVVVKDPSVENTAKDICVDQFGRVRVRFWWDRSWPPWLQNEHKGAEKRMTAWLRVAENWADNQWGTYFPARVGQEVIVSFIDGDPDRPIVTGRVYNGAQPPPFLQPGMQAQPLPPGAMKPESVKIQTELHYSGIKTQSTPRPNGAAGRFHLLRFDDSWQKEQYLIRSQNRMDVTAFDSYYDTTHGTRHLTIGGQDPKTLKCGGDFITKVYKNYHLRVGKDDDADPPGSMRTRVAQNYELAVGTGNIKGDMLLDLKRDMKTVVGGDYYLHVGGSSNGWRSTIIEGRDEVLVKQSSNQTVNINWNNKVGGQATIDAGTTIVLNAQTNISLVVGGSSIVITPATISITAPMVQINSGGSPASPSDPSEVQTNDPTLDPPSEPTQADPGDTNTPPK